MLFAEIDMKHFVQNLTYQSPLLMVYFGAFVFACIFFRRAPTACLLTIIGVVILVVTGVGQPIVLSMLMRDGNFDARSSRFNLFNIGMIACRALGTGLLVAAIFSGRGPSPDSYDRYDR
jgi:hypothetical protein